MEQRWKAICREDRRADKLVVRASGKLGVCIVAYKCHSNVHAYKHQQ